MGYDLKPNEHIYRIDVVSYDTWGNEKDGFEVNDLSYVEREIVLVGHKDISCKEIVKKVNKLCDYKIDFRKHNVIDNWPFIELEEKNGKPFGRFEITND